MRQGSKAAILVIGLADHLGLITRAEWLKAVRYRWCLLAAMLAVLLALGPWANDIARARNVSQFSRSYVTPFPEDDLYNLYVFGGSLGEGLWSGLDSSLASDQKIEVFRKIRYGRGFARTSGKDWAASIAGIVKQENVHIAVVMAGASERISIWAKGEKHKIGSDVWRTVVGKRVDHFIKTLQQEHIAIYWVGLPVMRSPKVNGQMQVLNEIFREKAFLNGVKYIDIWNGFTDQFGRYSAYGPDMSGNVKRLRADDGIHFTYRGNLKLAHFVEKEIRKDLALASQERKIPLAGGEEEQRRSFRRGPAVDDSGKKNAGKGKKAGGGKQKTGAKRRGWFGFIESKEADEKVTTIGDIEIVRPILSDESLSGFLGRRSNSGSSALIGEQIAKDMDGDVTAIASISSVNAISLRALKQRVPLTQSPYYKVLIKGEVLKPKPGRADDFSWPRNLAKPEKAQKAKE